MMKKIYTLMIALFIVGGAVGQGCLPDGITFETQAQIDSFQYNYPGCTEIEGSVHIRSITNYDITNLNGLSQVTSIGGYLMIQNNLNLTSLSGLENVSFIGNTITILGNLALSNLNGLEGLSSLDSSLHISSNNSLTSLSGLNNLTFIGDFLIVSSNESLTNLTGLENLTFIDKLSIGFNDALNSLTGLDNLVASNMTYLSIRHNSLLSTCDEVWLCDYLANPSGSINIYENAPGCDNPIEVAENCGITLSCLPYGNYYFNSQLDIDDFPNNYPSCFELEGRVIIRDNNDDITNLNGLSQVTSISGSLHIQQNKISSLIGLDNLTNIAGNLWIAGNDSLINLNGLNNVTSIGDGLVIWYNPSMTSLSGMDNLTTINNSLTVIMNPALTSLTGLDYIEASSIDGLYISDNPLLSQCEVESICEYLATSSGTIEIYNNTIGCNSPEEVLDSCEANAVTIGEIDVQGQVSIYPNPTYSTITIELPTQPSKNTTLTISNTNGQQLITQPITKPQTEIDISSLPTGIYIVKVWNNNDVMVQKVIKQ